MSLHTNGNRRGSLPLAAGIPLIGQTGPVQKVYVASCLFQDGTGWQGKVAAVDVDHALAVLRCGFLRENKTICGVSLCPEENASAIKGG